MNRILGVLSLSLLVGCGEGSNVGEASATSSTTGSTSTSTSASSSSGGTGGGGSSHCAMDCSSLKTEPCTVAVCNTGQIAGPTGVCVIVPVADGTACEDGLFCTANDTCQGGTCVGGPTNDCGTVPPACSTIVCNEKAKNCSVAQAADGTACTPTDLCQVDGACTSGMCVGQPKDCTFSPLGECNTVACDPTTGDCAGTPDPTKDGTPCALTGDLCSQNKACSSGQCTGGTPIDCSSLTLGCQLGSCDKTTGLCATVDAPVGMACTQGLATCQVGTCGMMGTCVPAQAPDATTCNDHDACTQTDACMAGVCTGTAIAGCKPYFTEGFENCPDGWTFGGDWQCGTPTSMSPVTPHTGKGVIATQLDGLYSVNQSYAMCIANSPAIDLTTATSPAVLFWAWVYTEGGLYDGWNIKVSSDGGPFVEIAKPKPAYPLNIAGQPAWGGDESALGWQPYWADLTPYAGHSVVLQYAFHSDAATVYPGVYIDDIIVAEAVQVPLHITTPAQLGNLYVGQGFSTTLSKVGGTSGSVWSIKPGGTNDAWLSITPTGVLSGTPTQAGPVSVTVRVEEPGFPSTGAPSNYDEQTFTFTVQSDVYFTGFEGTCPAGWTLTGDWQCGQPKLGPSAAFDGMQCIGTGMNQPYHNNDTWAGNTATSPLIDLTNVPNPMVSFRLWVHTESDQSDGANLKISTDGVHYTVLQVTPAYPLSDVVSQPAWGGDASAAGWQLVTADLTPWSGTKVYLRFGFESDGVNEMDAGVFPGVYVDDFLIK